MTTFTLKAFSFDFDSARGTYQSTGAVLVDDYRYRLWRHWAPGPRVVWIMLNPSTADGTQDDPTIRKCIGFTKRWGYAGIEVANLFAYRATSPAVMKRAKDPVGPDNDRHMLEAIGAAGGLGGTLVVAAWGVHGAHRNRSAALVRELRGRGVVLHHLGLAQGGEPRHPLMLAYETPLVRWENPRG